MREVVDSVASVQCWSIVGMSTSISPPTTWAQRILAIWVTCWTVDTCLTADQRSREFVADSVPYIYTFVVIDHEIISTAILFPSVDSRRAVFS